MLNKDQARMVAPLLNNLPAWEGLEEYLNSLKTLVVQALMVAQSESEMRQLQGRLVLLETLLNLNNNYKAVLKENNKSE